MKITQLLPMLLGNPVMDWHSIQGEVQNNNPLHFMLRKAEITSILETSPYKLYLSYKCVQLQTLQRRL